MAKIVSGVLVGNSQYHTVGSDVIASDTIVSGGGYWPYTSQTVLEGGSAVRTEVKAGRLFVEGGGYAESAVINGGDAEMYIRSGAAAKGLTLKNAGYVNVASGALVEGTLTIAKGANLNFTTGGVYNFALAGTTGAGEYFISDLSQITGTPTYTVTVSANQSSGTYKLAQGASAFAGTLSIGDGTVEYGSVTVNGEDLVFNNTTYSLDLVGSDLTLTIETKPSVFLYSNGTLVKQENILTGETLAAGANDSMVISSGGSALQTIVNAGGIMSVLDSGKAVETAINEYGTVILSSGAAADGTIVNANGGLHVYSGAAASNTTVKQGGYLGVGLGATTYGTTIDYAGALTVWGGGVAYDNTINEYGAIILSSGAVADTTVVNSTGGLHVYAGAVASNTTVKQGGFFGVGLGATTYNTLIDYAGELTVWSGGVVHGNEIDQWGAIILLDGAVANSTTINPGGGLHIYNGATAFTTEVTSGANLGIGYGGCVYSTELDNTGTMTFYEGAIMTGWNNFEGTVITSGGVNGLGAYVNFELDDRTADQGAILDDIGNFYSVTRYSMEVGLDQALGTYDLAGDASDFDERVTLYIGDGNDCGSLAVGEYLDYNDKRYTLENNNGTLALKIS